MELDHKLYTVAWIAPLEIEARAAACMLDHEHDGRFSMQRGDDYVYQAGEVCGHNVIIATLPAGQEYGTGSAAALASQVKKFFPNIWFGLLVGVAAGLPRLTGPLIRDIRLGDVLVALPEGNSAGLVAYDLGKETGSDGFQLLRGGDALAVTETVVRAAIGSIKRRAPNDANLILPYYDKIKNQEHGGGTFADPGQGTDRLYGTDEAGRPAIQRREPRPDKRRTRIWYGPIGSGEKLMKNASRRNKLRDRYNIIGLEMEAAGTMNRIPVGVIRGVCDYGDEHKNKEWQPYAAAMAAAYAKAVLAQIGPSRPTSVCYIPFRRNHNFTGRRTQLDRLEQMLFRENRERVAVVGLGGMGKTQIALELAHRVRNMEVEGVTQRYSVFWVPAQSMATFHKTAGELVQRLDIHCGNDDPKEALRTYLESDTAGHWLLVVDNVDDTVLLDGKPGHSNGLSGLLPQSRKGRLLITTRQTSLAVNVAGNDIVKLSSMTFDEAYSLMGILLLDKSQVRDIESTKELLKKLTCLPLTLAQAAAYMNKNGTPIVRYLELCRSADQNMVDLLSKRLRDETHHSQAQGAVVTTLIVSFEAIRETDSNAVRLLSFIRWIEPKAIPISMLPDAGSQIDLEDSIGLLCGAGLCLRVDGRTSETVKCFELLAAVRERTQAETHPDRLDSQHELARAYLADDQVEKAIKTLERVVALREQTLVRTHSDRLSSQRALASAYQANSQVEKAIELLEYVVALREQTLAETHPDRLSSQRALASAYQANGQVEDAVKMLVHVVATEKHTLAETHPDRLSSQHALASAYQANGQVEKAIELLEHVVAIQKQTLAETHPFRLLSQHALASAYQAKSKSRKRSRC
ncbi:Nephrocystin-3 [Beauveria bassiana D1-5]|uniref:Nephrocystin-3 n=1 Tax=Beauveria bassiana D1-5 TaxID=1245745 RepID=A0A0A2VGK9_BEABA|nr:Nephrocystin-3 [Beauveria bassiana D1-5]